MKGKQIKTVEELLKQKSVWVERWQRTSPIAFLQNWQARQLLNWVKIGQFYKYKKK